MSIFTISVEGIIEGSLHQWMINYASASHLRHIDDIKTYKGILIEFNKTDEKLQKKKTHIGQVVNKMDGGPVVEGFQFCEDKDCF